MKSYRVERVSELIKQEISKIIQFDIKKKGLGFITVTDVMMSKDLRIARVFVSVFGSDKIKKETIDLLTKSIGYIKWKISERVKLRFMPEILFKLDTSAEKSQRIDEILKKIKDGKNHY